MMNIMESVVQSDVFFFVTTICIVVLTVIGVIIGIQVIRILGEYRKFKRQMRKFYLFFKTFI
jgi:hypothetical protein